MKTEKHRKINLLIHLIVILTFMLPFFYIGCEREKQNEVVPTNDTLVETFIEPKNEVVPTNDTLVETITDPKNEMTKEKSLSEAIAIEYPIFRYILTPREEALSGLAVIINYFTFANFLFMFVLAFTVLISVLSKLLEKQALKIFLFIDTVSLILLIFSESPAWNNDKLFGYWVCMIFILLLVLHDIYRIKITKR